MIHCSLTPEQLDACVRRIQQGDTRAFGELFRATQKELRVFLSAHAASLDQVDEVLQAAYVTCYRSIQKYELRGTFLSWLKGIARNLLLKDLRERARSVAIEGHVLEGYVVRGSLERFEREGRDPEDSDRRLEGCLGKLRSHSRELIRRRYVERHSISEMARSLNRSESWVAVTLHRIRESLRACLMGSEPAYDR